MGYPSCIELSNINADCAAVRRVGGVNARVWIGNRTAFLENENIYFEYGDPESALGRDVWFLKIEESETTGQELAYFEGVALKNSGGFETVPGPNVNLFTHLVNIVLYHKSKESKDKLQKLLLAEDLFFILLTEAGEIMVYGIDYDDNNVIIPDKYGLKPLTATGGDIVEMQGEVGVVTQLNAVNMTKIPFLLEAVDFEGIAITSVLETVGEMVDAINTLSAEND